MVSALIVLLLGCWLAGRSRVSGEMSYPKPSISVSPGGVIPVGGNVTIRCRHQHRGLRFLLYKAGDGNYLNYMDPAGSEAEFPITGARRDHGGRYLCRYSNRTGPTAYSEPSDPVQIIVADPSFPRPSISLTPTGVTALGTDVTIRCEGPRRDVRFFLHKAGDLNPPRDTDPAGNGTEFHIPTVGRQHGGNYSCSYRLRSEPFVSSPPSPPVQLVVAGGPDPTQPGAAPAPTRPGSTTGPGGSERPGLAIITGVSAAATGLLLLLLLLVAFVCFRRTQARKGAAQRPRSTIPLGVLKAPAQQDPIDTSVDEGKEPQTLEPDPEGLTYAELDGRALQTKRGGPAPAPEPALYAAVNVSRRAPQ